MSVSESFLVKRDLSVSQAWPAEGRRAVRFMSVELRVWRAFRDLRQSRRLEIVNGSKPYSPMASAPRQVEDIRVAP